MLESRVSSALLKSYVILICFLLLFPLALVLLISFDSATYIKFPPVGYNLRWYDALFRSDTFLLSVYNSLIVATVSTAIAAVFSVPASIVIARRRFFGRDVIYALLLSSLTVPWLVFGLAVLFLWGLLDLQLSLTTLVFAHTAIAVPYIVRTCTAVMASLPVSYEKAARNLGASPLKAFLFVTLPLMAPGLRAGCAFAFVISMVNIPVALFLTTADNLTMPISIFTYMANDFDPGVAAYAVIQFVLIMFCLVLASRAGRVTMAAR
ncbi:MAG: ABC transporter permease [Pseudorhodoplanes sp.]